MSFTNCVGSSTLLLIIYFCRVACASPLATISVLTLAAGALPISSAAVCSDSDVCSFPDELETGAAAPITGTAEFDGKGVLLPHSLLQVAKPMRHRQLSKATVVDEATQEAGHGSKGKKLDSPPTGSSIDSGAQPARALSFFQMTGAVIEDHASKHGASAAAFTGVTGITGKTLRADQIHLPWWRGCADFAVVLSAIGLLAWTILWLTSRCFKPWVLQYHRSFQTDEPARVDLSFSHKAHSPLVASVLGEPRLADTGVSFAVPLTHHTETGNMRNICFNLPRRPDGPLLYAAVTCNPQGATLAKVEIFSGEACTSGATKLASCTLLHSTPDVESRNVQGAMLEWLSLLLHEREGANTTPREKDQLVSDKAIACSRQSQSSRARVCLHGIAEELLHLGLSSVGNTEDRGSNGLKMEVCDSHGFLGMLEPGEKPGMYSMRDPQGKSLLDIEAHADSRNIMVRREDEQLAVTTNLGCRRDPEMPELAGEEDEYLQVDIKEGVEFSDVALLLTCTLSMIVFKPKASMLKGEKAAAPAAPPPEDSEVEVATVPTKVLPCMSQGSSKPLTYYSRKTPTSTPRDDCS